MTERATLCHPPDIGKRETQFVKLTAERPYSDPEKAARRLMEHAHAFEPINDGWIYIEKINARSYSGTRQPTLQNIALG